MPVALRQYMPAEVSDAQIARYFGNMRLIRALPIDGPVRQGAIEAYQEVAQRYLWSPALGIAFIPLIAAFCQTNFHLDGRQNAINHRGTDGQPKGEVEDEFVKEYPAGWKGTLLKFWDGKPQTANRH